jgi:hypothetical protein
MSRRTIASPSRPLRACGDRCNRREISASKQPWKQQGQGRMHAPFGRRQCEGATSADPLLRNGPAKAVRAEIPTRASDPASQAVADRAYPSPDRHRQTKRAACRTATVHGLGHFGTNWQESGRRRTNVRPARHTDLQPATHGRARVHRDGDRAWLRTSSCTVYVRGRRWRALERPRTPSPRRRTGRPSRKAAGSVDVDGVILIDPTDKTAARSTSAPGGRALGATPKPASSPQVDDGGRN